MEQFANWCMSTAFRMTAYVAFGLIMEIGFTAISALVDGKVTDEDKRLRGVVSLYMIPVYGILLLAMFEPVYFVMLRIDTPWFIRAVLWALLITGTEALCGWLYARFLKVKPWDYSQCKDRIFPGGYARWAYVPLWGIAGLFLEVYVTFVVNLSTYVPSVIRNFEPY